MKLHIVWEPSPNLPDKRSSILIKTSLCSDIKYFHAFLLNQFHKYFFDWLVQTSRTITMTKKYTPAFCSPLLLTNIEVNICFQYSIRSIRLQPILVNAI